MRSVQICSRRSVSNGMASIDRQRNSAAVWHQRLRVDALVKLAHRLPHQFLTWRLWGAINCAPTDARHISPRRMESRRTGLFDVPEIPLLCVGLHHESEQMHPVSPQGCSGGIYDASQLGRRTGVINAATTSFEEDLLLVSKTIMKPLPCK